MPHLQISFRQNPFLLIACLLFMLTRPAFAWQDDARISALFAAQKLSGTFVLLDVASGTMSGHDAARANTRFIPASTFKIPNTLIGLTTGAVKSVDEILPYGGQPQPYPQWEKDMNLRDAIKVSNVPVYQELARRIGMQRMQENMARLHYGNGETGSVVDRFWLDGPLQISAVEQVQFLAQLAQGKLPFPKEAQDGVLDITLLEKNERWTLHGKTGWGTATKPGIGWWVGWVEKQGRIYAFALNIDMQSAEDVPKRMALGKASLAASGILD